MLDKNPSILADQVGSVQSEGRRKKFDVAIVGGGILGVTISYWLSSLYDCSIALIEKENQVAMHTSSRNTGVIHRPFYLDPKKKRVFARAAQKSYYLWKGIASRYNLGWKPHGTIEVALEEEQQKTLSQYEEWSLQNGMNESEVEILDSAQVQKLEPEVRCAGAIFSKNDTSVDYRELTNFVFSKASKNGVIFVGGSKVRNLNESRDGIRINLEIAGEDRATELSADLLINSAGGGAIDIVHALDLGKEFTDLHFRGEYWIVDEPFASRISRNVYSVARHREFSFLDPHYIVRSDGIREIGPNAVLVSGPNTYQGLSEKRFQLISKIFERPVGPKLKLFTNGAFLSLVWDEWRSSLSKKVMCERVKQFVPSIDVSCLNHRGLAGVRSSVIDDKGFVPEAILVNGENSFHILNYNSPGATGAPAFSAYVISKIKNEGYMDGKKKRKEEDKTKTAMIMTAEKEEEIEDGRTIWNFEDASDL